MKICFLKVNKLPVMNIQITLLAFCIGISVASLAKPSTDTIPANASDVKSIDAIVHALYDVISGDAGIKRDWNRMRSLFLPEGKLIPTGMRNDTVRYRIMTVEDYIKSTGAILEEKGFHEKEISKKTEHFGHIAHVFSTYESKYKLTDEKPFMRGINSIQLLNDGKRWWILHVYWNSETPASPIPKRYL